MKKEKNIMKKKMLVLLACGIFCMASVVGCSSESDENKQQAENSNKMSEAEVDAIFEKISNEECKIDNNIFTWLEPTHKQAKPYPYDYIYEGYGKETKEYLSKVGHLLWSPNKHFIVDNVKSIEYERKTYTSFDEILDDTLGIKDFLEIDLDEKALGYEGYEIHYTTDKLSFSSKVDDDLTLREAIDKNIWIYTDVPWATQWWYEHGDFENTTTEDGQWQVLKQLIKDWGMPTEVYYNVNDSVGVLTGHRAQLYWDCDGYDVVYSIKKSLGIFEITSAIIYGDGFAEYESEPIIVEDAKDNKKLQ